MTTIDLTAINIPFPQTNERHLRIAAGACHLHIKPAEGSAWVTGSYQDPSGSLPYRLMQDAGSVTIRQELNPAEMFNLFSGVPRFDLMLGKSQHYALTIEAGASDSFIDLGGLPLKVLTISHGASHYMLDFSAPNPQPLSLMQIGAGAGSIDARNLVNANFSELRVGGGAAAYRLNFDGSLRQNALVKIATGVSTVEISVPGSTSAKISHEAMMASIDIGDGFMKKEGAFWTEAALAGKTPMLTIQTNVALGTLRIRAT
jgi:hypothetical protein